MKKLVLLAIVFGLLLAGCDPQMRNPNYKKIDAIDSPWVKPLDMKDSLSKPIPNHFVDMHRDIEIYGLHCQVYSCLWCGKEFVAIPGQPIHSDCPFYWNGTEKVHK